jgi:hypothetical protein
MAIRHKLAVAYPDRRAVSRRAVGGLRSQRPAITGPYVRLAPEASGRRLQRQRLRLDISRSARPR